MFRAVTATFGTGAWVESVTEPPMLALVGWAAAGKERNANRQAAATAGRLRGDSMETSCYSPDCELVYAHKSARSSKISQNFADGRHRNGKEYNLAPSR